MKDLKDLRNLIDDIDTKMATLFEQRMMIVKDVALYKEANKIPVFDESRENEVIEKNTLKIENIELIPFYKQFLKDTMGISKDYQKQILNNYIIGYQGTEGAFSYLTAKHLFASSTLKSFSTFEEVFLAVKNNIVDYGVLPFENSYTGVVGEVLDLLAKYDLHFNQIYDLQVEQNLLGLKGTNINDITDIYSHHQAIEQSGKFLKQRGFNIHEYPNTALAAKFIYESQDKTKAAIASMETAKLYDLEVISPNISTSNNNITRFIVLTKQLETVGNRFNLSFTLPNEVGSLSKVINTISSYNFSMEKIQSRPVQDIPFEYYFHIEIVGILDSLESNNLISDLKNYTKGLKILGCHKK